MARVLYHGWQLKDVPVECGHLLRNGSSSLLEICRIVEDASDEPEIRERMTESEPVLMTTCLRGDQTGDLTFGGEFVVLYRFVPEYPTGPEMCPVVAGYEPSYGFDTSGFEGPFSADELYSQLGLLPYVCVYFPEGFYS